MVFDHNKDSEVFVPFFIVDNTISSKKRFWKPVIPDQLGPEPPHATIGLTQGSMVDRLVGTAHAKEAIGSRFSM